MIESAKEHVTTAVAELGLGNEDLSRALGLLASTHEKTDQLLELFKELQGHGRTISRELLVVLDGLIEVGNKNSEAAECLALAEVSKAEVCAPLPQADAAMLRARHDTQQITDQALSLAGAHFVPAKDEVQHMGVSVRAAEAAITEALPFVTEAIAAGARYEGRI